MNEAFDQVDFPIDYYWGRYRKHIGIGAVVLLAIVLISSVFYKVEADSEGVVLRFGKYAKTTDPGLHVKLFWPIETVHIVPVRRIQSAGEVCGHISKILSQSAASSGMMT